MIIRNHEVTDWHDLERRVKQLFQEMGYRADSPHTISLSGRGSKEIDVYVQDERASVRHVCLVECKWWETHVPQDIVHAFCTVMIGAGANIGFIVSKKGFQSGAHEAATATNINLLSFEELQKAYGNEWYRHQFYQLNEEIANIRVEGHLYFDQFSPLVTPNSLRFHTSEHRQRLHDFNTWSRCLLLLADIDRPRSFNVDGPIETSVGPNAPWSPEYATTDEGHEFASVREYFAVVIDAARRWTDEFTAFKHHVFAEFDELLPEHQAELMARNLVAFMEETPIKALKGGIPEEQYAELLVRLQQKTMGTREQPGALSDRKEKQRNPTQGSSPPGGAY